MRARNKMTFESFVSLAWYETTLRFIANFIAKTSELLLGAGLVVSTANFLTDGAILGPGSPGSTAWAWAQALAIDSGLGVTLYYALHAFKLRDWLKGVLYSMLTGLLSLVAGTITNIDIFSHAVHTSIQSSMDLIGINVHSLSLLRSIAVVGFVLMSRLRDVSLKDFDVSMSETPSEPREPALIEGAQPRFTVEDMALLLRAFVQQPGTGEAAPKRGPLGQRTSPTISEVVPEPLSSPQEVGSGAERQGQNGVAHMTAEGAERARRVPEPSPAIPVAPPASGAPTSIAPQVHQAVAQGPVPSDVPTRQERERVELSAVAAPNLSPQGEPRSSEHNGAAGTQEERLTRAYLALLSEGQKVSGRTLAERAHIHRSTCVDWLRTKYGPVAAGAQREKHESAEEGPAMEPLAMQVDPIAASKDAAPGESPEIAGSGNASPP